MQEETCPACGESNRPDAAFCRTCGEYLGWDQRAPRREDPEPTRSPAPAPARDSPAPTGPAAPVTPPAGTATTDTASSEPARHGTAPIDTAPIVTAPIVTAPIDTAPIDTVVTTSATRDDPTPQPEEEARAGPAPCPGCGTENDPARRFCRRCGHAFLPDAAKPPSAPRARRRARWRDALRSRAGGTREARRAYRRALPLRYRVGRVAVVLLPLALVVGMVAVNDRDPVGAARDLWYDLWDERVEVDGVRASADPPGAVLGEEWRPELAVDGTPGNAWATSWDPSAPEAPACEEGAATGAVEALLLEWDGVGRIQRLEITSGVPAADVPAAQVRRPRELEIRFETECRSVVLDDTGEVQTVDLGRFGGVDAERLRVEVMSVHEPTGGAGPDVVAISEIRVLSRPR